MTCVVICCGCRMSVAILDISRTKEEFFVKFTLVKINLMTALDKYHLWSGRLSKREVAQIRMEEHRE